jgi:hypothetical protein
MMFKKTAIVAALLLISAKCFCWGFFAHKKINNYSVFLLPPEMLSFYKANIDFITEHAIDPDKRRYAIKEEGPRHYIDIDHYGTYPYDSLPRNWKGAVAKYGEDSLGAHGIGPWWTLGMLSRLTDAFKDKNKTRILKISAEIGHYIADLHVPLHTSSNHNGQKSSQQGIHGFWESRLPELLADTQWDFFIGQAEYLKSPSTFLWSRVLESAAASDTVLRFEAQLNQQFPSDRKYAFENRNGVVIRQYSSAYSMAYDKMMKGMVERRMRQSVFAVASFWYTAWVNAGQPDLSNINNQTFSEADVKEFEELNRQWQAGAVKGRSCD